jgi:hypothetical protein
MLTLYRTYNRLEQKIKEDNWKKAAIYAQKAKEWLTRAYLIAKALSDGKIIK